MAVEEVARHRFALTPAEVASLAARGVITVPPVVDPLPKRTNKLWRNRLAVQPKAKANGSRERRVEWLIVLLNKAETPTKVV